MDDYIQNYSIYLKDLKPLIEEPKSSVSDGSLELDPGLQLELGHPDFHTQSCWR